jgi:hypothetical protein
VEQIPLSETYSRSTEKKVPTFMEPNCSLPCSKKPVTGVYSQYDESSPSPHIQFSLTSIAILFSHLRLVSEMVSTLEVLLTQIFNNSNNTTSFQPGGRKRPFRCEWCGLRIKTTHFLTVPRSNARTALRCRCCQATSSLRGFFGTAVHLIAWKK